MDRETRHEGLGFAAVMVALSPLYAPIATGLRTLPKAESAQKQALDSPVTYT